jgi:hypothetical protein
MTEMGGEARSTCPRCGIYGEQTWSRGRDLVLPVGWSFCHACRHISVWRGPVLVHPASGRARNHPATAASRRTDALAEAVRLEALWEAVRHYLAEMRILAESGTPPQPRDPGEQGPPPAQPRP